VAPFNPNGLGASWLHSASGAGSLRNPRVKSLELAAGAGEIGSVFAVVAARLQAAATRAATAVRETLRPAPMVSGFVADLFRIRGELLNLGIRAAKRPSSDISWPYVRPATVSAGGRS
jgi:hypothetical protein